MRNRKEEILTVALHLFARDGYEAVSVSQIAGELDMTKGALYRHYKSKRDIFDCIVERMEQGDSEQAAVQKIIKLSLQSGADAASYRGRQLLAQEDLPQSGMAGRHVYGTALLHGV